MKKLTFELVCSYIHSTSTNPLYQVARKQKVKLYCPQRTAIYCQDGTMMQQGLADALLHRVWDVHLNAAECQHATSLHDYMLDPQHGLRDGFEGEKVELVEKLVETIEGYQAAPLSELSTQTVCEDGEGEEIVSDGYQTFLDIFLEPLLGSVSVSFNEPVSHIVASQGK
jgi:hypothetical protein